MGKFIAEQTVKQMIAAGSYVKGAKVNILGLTFKENCADLRNSKVVDIIHELQSYSIEVFVHEPEATADEAMREYGVRLYSWDELPRADAIVAAVAHRRFLDLDIEDLSKKIIKGGAFVDVKAQFDAARLRSAGISVWRL
jgi:UDP-N-acetyl-D-galactosamine dehydrogenase